MIYHDLHNSCESYLCEILSNTREAISVAVAPENGDQFDLWIFVVCNPQVVGAVQK